MKVNKELNLSIKELFGLDLNAEIIKSNRPDLCDYQYNGTFDLAKTLHENPYTIGMQLKEYLDKNEECQKRFFKFYFE